MTTFFNEYQYDDLLAKPQDLYANAKYEIILSYLSRHERLNILNAGCGSGELSLLLASAGHRVLGIDPAAQYIEIAQRNSRVLGDRSHCSFAVSTIEDFTPPATYDCVLATDVLEHIKDDRSAFEKMICCVKPGGLIVITVPAGKWLFGYHDEAIGHFRRYSRVTLRGLVEDLCHIDKMRYFGFSLIPVCYLYSKILRKPYPVAESGDRGKKPVTATILRWLMKLEKLVPMPLGTSLILKGTRR